MCVKDEKGYSLFADCSCPYKAAENCPNCRKTDAFRWPRGSWITFHIFSLSIVFILSLLGHALIIISKASGIWFGIGAFLVISAIVILIDTRKSHTDAKRAKNGDEARIFLDKDGLLHLHGTREKFSSFTTGFMDGGCMPISPWRDAYGYDGRIFLRLFYGEVSGKNSVIYSPDDNFDGEAGVLPRHSRHSILLTKNNWMLTVEDDQGNRCLFFPGELIWLMHQGESKRFSKGILRGADNRIRLESAQNKLEYARILEDQTTSFLYQIAESLIRESEKSRPPTWFFEIGPHILTIMGDMQNFAKSISPDINRQRSIDIINLLAKKLVRKNDKRRCETTSELGHEFAKSVGTDVHDE